MFLLARGDRGGERAARRRGPAIPGHLRELDPRAAGGAPQDALAVAAPAGPTRSACLPRRDRRRSVVRYPAAGRRLRVAPWRRHLRLPARGRGRRRRDGDHASAPGSRPARLDGAADPAAPAARTARASLGARPAGDRRKRRAAFKARQIALALCAAQTRCGPATSCRAPRPPLGARRAGCLRGARASRRFFFTQITPAPPAAGWRIALLIFNKPPAETSRSGCRIAAAWCTFPG